MSRNALSLVCTLVLGISTAIAAPQTAQLMNPPVQPDALGCKLVYQQSGAPLLQNVKVFDVFYNTGNPYRDMLSSYYTAITQSAHFDWLSEYNVPNFKIGRLVPWLLRGQQVDDHQHLARRYGHWPVPRWAHLRG